MRYLNDDESELKEEAGARNKIFLSFLHRVDK
jgi:hypothetical protein